MTQLGGRAEVKCKAKLVVPLEGQEKAKTPFPPARCSPSLGSTCRAGVINTFRCSAAEDVGHVGIRPCEVVLLSFGSKFTTTIDLD